MVERWERIWCIRSSSWKHPASQVVPVVKNPPATAGDLRHMGSIPGSGRSPGGGNGSPLKYSCWRTPWTEEPGRPQSIGSQRVGHDYSDLAQHGMWAPTNEDELLAEYTPGEDARDYWIWKARGQSFTGRDEQIEENTKGLWSWIRARVKMGSY